MDSKPTELGLMSTFPFDPLREPQYVFLIGALDLKRMFY